MALNEARKYPDACCVVTTEDGKVLGTFRSTTSAYEFQRLNKESCSDYKTIYRMYTYPADYTDEDMILYALHNAKLARNEEGHVEDHTKWREFFMETHKKLRDV